MTNIHETACPILPAEPSAAELKASFTPTTAEMRFVRKQSRQESTAVLIMVQQPEATGPTGVKRVYEGLVAGTVRSALFVSQVARRMLRSESPQTSKSARCIRPVRRCRLIQRPE
jgi:hypothetical protein